jgi:hypothetical protein
MGLVDSTEIEDFHSIIAKAGYSKNDFELFDKERPLPAAPAGSLFLLTGTVVVKRRSTGVERRYPTGGTSWLVEFEKDLRAGAFGRVAE